MFKSVSSRFNVTLLEEEIARFWKTHRIYEKLRSARQDAQAFTIYECPHTIFGKPDLQTIQARVHHDFWTRYKTMRGFHVIRHSGWNTHGLPIEFVAENRLGLNNYLQVEQYGIERFNDFCRQLSVEFTHAWETLEDRLNGWDELETAPVTHDKHSVEIVWNLFKQAWDKGLIVQDEGILPYCPRCGTVIADYEALQGTKQIDTLNVLVRLPLLEDPNTSLLISTDRIWSLTGNVAVAANPDAEYVIIEHDVPETVAGSNAKPEKMILAKALLERVFGDEAVRVYETFKGIKLKGLKYRPLFQFLLADRPLHHIIMDDLYVPETGSGLVQISPAFNAHDLELAKQNDLPVLTSIAQDGKFVADVRPWRGMYYKDAEAYIQQDLYERGLLYRTETVNQSASFCLGCGSALLPYLRSAWYLRNQKPGKDWVIGRDRFWGTPLPLWKCIHCGHQHVVSSLEDLTHLAGRTLTDIDLHRPWVDDVSFTCPRCDGLMRRLPQVLDAQLDAAALSLFQIPRKDEESYLADLVCEVPMQAEGWLYALTILHTLFFDGQSFRHSIFLPPLVEAREKLLNHDRQTLSDPWDIVHDHGADALRWTLLSTCPPGDQFEFSNELLASTRNNLVPPLWNAFTVLVNHAAQADWSPIRFSELDQSSLTVLDQWILSRLHLLVQEMTNALESFDSNDAAVLLQAFINELANWYIPLSMRRFGEKEEVTDRQAAFATLYQVVVTLSKLLSPFVPFLAEELHQKLVRPFDMSSPISVHLTDWPTPDADLIDLELNRKMILVQRLGSLGLAAREDAGVALHQPLVEAVVTFGSQAEADLLRPFVPVLQDALHVRAVTFEVEDTAAVPGEIRITLDTHLTVELVQEGLADEFVRRVQVFRQKAGFDQEAGVYLLINATPRLAEAINAFQSRIMEGTHCLDLKLVSQQLYTGSIAEQGRSSRRLYTMIEFDGERATFGIEKVPNP